MTQLAGEDAPAAVARVYVDTHCHLVSGRYGGEEERVAARSLAAGVRMLTVGADAASSRASVALAERCPGVRAAVGVHPTESLELEERPGPWREIEALAARDCVAAVGETGLDYYWKDCPVEVQKKWFDRHMELARSLGKPVSVHARESVRDCLGMLSPHLEKGLAAVWHCFVAGKKDIDWALDFCIDHGVLLGIGGLITFEDQKPLRARAERIPEALLLLETDAPYLVPRPRTMDRNEPLGVLRVAEVLAELRGVAPGAIADATTRNALRVFGEWI